MQKYAIVLLLAALGCSASPAQKLATPSPVRASMPCPVNRVISAVIWPSPHAPAESRIFITNAARGLEVHDLDGYLLKHLDEGYETDSVALLPAFKIAGKSHDLILATYPDRRVGGVKVWIVDAEKSKLREPASGQPFFTIADNPLPTGIAACISKKTGKAYVFITARTGDIDQLELLSDDKGAITAKPVRKLKVPSKTQSCIADPANACVYFCEEKAGVWKFDLEPDAAPKGEKVIQINEHDLAPDLEGIALYNTSDTAGYLIVVSQGSKSGVSLLNLYDRNTHAFVGTIKPSPKDGNGIEFASGIAATSTPMPPLYPRGLLLIKDHINTNASEDFKYYSWQDIATPLKLP